MREDGAARPRVGRKVEARHAGITDGEAPAALARDEHPGARLRRPPARDVRDEAGPERTRVGGEALGAAEAVAREATGEDGEVLYVGKARSLKKRVVLARLPISPR